MTAEIKAQIGRRLRFMREQAGYTREKLGELCSLSPRFIANIELGDSTFSLDSLMNICRVLSCSSDYILFGTHDDDGPWDTVISKLRNTDPKYQASVEKSLQGVLEIIATANNMEQKAVQHTLYRFCCTISVSGASRLPSIYYNHDAAQGNALGSYLVLWRKLS